jgi:tetratricopeptide (TPR) repeat protein
MFANKTHEIGHELLLNGKYTEAIALFTDALEIDPNHPDIYSDRGVAYLHLKNEQNCMADLDTALTLQPEYAFRFASRAYAKDFFGNTEAAIEDYEKAVALDPEDAVAHNNLGLLLEKLGFQKQAQENFKRADALSKQEKKLFDLIAEIEDNELESSPELSNTEAIERNNANTIDSASEMPEESDSVKKPSTFQEFRRIFTSKLQFSEFLHFIKNGFRIK